MFRLMSLAAIAAVCAALSASQAHAQFGPFFGDGPPRPPGAIRNQPPPPPIDDDEEVPELPQGRLLPAPNRPLPGGQGAPPPGSYQSQPLPPPPGSAAPPNPQAPPPAANAPGAATTPPPTANAPAAQPPAKGAARGPAPPSPATLQPGDEIVTEPPKQKIVNKKAVFSGLDKITGRITTFDADIGETVQFGALRVKPDACYTRPATEATNTDAFVEVDEITLQGEVKRIFSGWMFAASPGLHGVEHPIYDIWLADCKAPDAAVAAQQPAPAAAPAAPKQQPRAQPKQQAPRPQAPPPPQQAPLLPPFGR